MYRSPVKTRYLQSDTTMSREMVTENSTTAQNELMDKEVMHIIISKPLPYCMHQELYEDWNI